MDKRTQNQLAAKNLVHEARCKAAELVAFRSTGADLVADQDAHNLSREGLVRILAPKDSTGLLGPFMLAYPHLFLPDQYSAAFLRACIKVAEVGTVRCFLSSMSHPGFDLALVCCAKAERIRSAKVFPSVSMFTEERTSTTPAEREAGLPPTKFDLWYRSMVIDSLALGVTDAIPRGFEHCLPAPYEKDYLDFAKKVTNAPGAHRKRMLAIRKALDLAPQIVELWLPLCLWQKTTIQGLKAMKKRVNDSHIKAYDEAVRKYGLKDSRCARD